MFLSISQHHLTRLGRSGCTEYEGHKGSRALVFQHTRSARRGDGRTLASTQDASPGRAIEGTVEIIKIGQPTVTSSASASGFWDPFKWPVHVAAARYSVRHRGTSSAPAARGGGARRCRARGTLAGCPCTIPRRLARRERATRPACDQPDRRSTTTPRGRHASRRAIWRPASARGEHRVAASGAVGELQIVCARNKSRENGVSTHECSDISE